MRSILIAGVIGIICLAACKKDYTCSCNQHTDLDQGTVIIDTNYTIVLKKEKKKDAKSKCEANNLTKSVTLFTYSGSQKTTCSID